MEDCLLRWNLGMNKSIQERVYGGAPGRTNNINKGTKGSEYAWKV